MRNDIQVRDRIFGAVDSLCKQNRESLSAFTARIGISASMLYKFRAEGGPNLGRDTVNALAPLLPDVDAATWLAAMGVEASAPVEASA